MNKSLLLLQAGALSDLFTTTPINHKRDFEPYGKMCPKGACNAQGIIIQVD